MAHDDPGLSTRQIARTMNLGHTSVHRVLKDEKLRPYHFTLVQQLKEEDYPRRVEFCQWLLRQNEADNNFLNNVLWTDEALFTREGLFNQHNAHHYAEENPFLTRDRGYQNRWKLNIWAGIRGDQIIGPCRFDHYLRGENYRGFLENTLPGVLEDVPLNIRTQLWYQHDGAPAHNHGLVTGYLREKFGERWMGYRGPVRWPARSPDLTPLDFFLWGHVKDVAYATEPDTPEEVAVRLRAAIASIDGALLRRVQRNIIHRAELCVEVNGRQFQQLL